MIVDPDEAEFDAALALVDTFGFDGMLAIEVVRLVRRFFAPVEPGSV